MDKDESMKLNESIASLIDVLEKINFNIEKQNEILSEMSDCLYGIKARTGR